MERITAAAEPLYTCKDAFEILPVKIGGEDDGLVEEVTLYGNLCTAMDLAAKDIKLPHLDIGDLLVFTNAGSYAAVLTPMQFSSQEKPVELFLKAEGEVIL